eukprot:3943996-Pyramimonas_sp.AAC.1
MRDGTDDGARVAVRDDGRDRETHKSAQHVHHNLRLPEQQVDLHVLIEVGDHPAGGYRPFAWPMPSTTGRT